MVFGLLVKVDSVSVPLKNARVKKMALNFRIQ